MAKRMKLWVVGALLLAAVGGTVVASNMGFKLVPNFAAGNKTYTISLPLNQNYTNAKSLMVDINAVCPTVGSVDRTVPSAGGTQHQTWLSSNSGANFTVSKSEGYAVATGASPCTSWVVVGSHDPAYTYQFPTGNKRYLVSIPYHTTATNAKDLLTTMTLVSAIDRIVPSAGGTQHQTWLASNSGANFAVTIGEAYGVDVTGTTTWIPAHY